MVNEVKLNNINPYYSKENYTDPQNKPVTQDSQAEEVAITNHLDELIKSVNSYEEPMSGAALDNIKYQVQHNEYKVDFDKLSEKLLNSGIISMMGD